MRYLGHSNFAGWEIAEAHYVAKAVCRALRLGAEPLQPAAPRRRARRAPAVERFGLGFLPYFPLHNGLLTGKFTRDGGPEESRIMTVRPHLWRDAPWDALEALQAFCDERGITILDATMGWLLARPSLSSVIAGATSPEQVRSNAAAATAWTPSADEVAAIDALFPLPADPAA